MKKIVVCLLALSTFFACKKDCPACKQCDNKTDTLTDTVYTNPPDTSCKTNLPKGLLAYFPFNGNFNDESGNGNNASAKNGAYLTTDMVGRASRSAGFDGVDDYVIVPGNPKLNADTVTISFQVMVNNVNRRNVTISKVNFQNSLSYSYGIHHNLTDHPGQWGFGVAPGTDDCSQAYAYSPIITTYANGTMEAGRWYNVLASFVNGTQKIYIDGVLQTSATRTFNNVKKCNDGDLMIGGWWKNDIVSIDGKIDEVRLYNRVLTDCEIKRLAEANTTGN
jgi:hypothetical protein